jgi:MFS family permease
MATTEFNRKSLTAAWAASTGMLVGTTPMISAVASLFIVPISREFHISRAGYALLMLVSPYIVALCAPFGGQLIDRYGTRRVLLPVVLVFGLMQLAMWAATAQWQVVVLFALFGVAGGVHSYTAYTRVISSWFGQRRGLILGLMLALGSSLGSVLVPQMVRRLNETYGWRAGYVGMGCVILLYGLPVLWLHLREPLRAARPARALNAMPPHAQLYGQTFAQAVRTREFWIICSALLFAPLCIIGTIGSSVPMLTERGFSAAVATNALSTVYIGAMVGQLSAGALLDRFDTPRIVLPFFGLALIGAVIMHTSSAAATLLPGAVLMGFGQGTEMGIGSYLITRFCGLRNFGLLYGCVFAAANLGLGLGLYSMGYVYDLTGSYAPMAYVLPGALLLAMALLLSLGPYRYPRETVVSEADLARG